MRAIGLEEYLATVSHPTVRYVSGFIAFSKNCLHRCMDCGHEWQARPANVKLGRCCPECARIKRNKSKEMSVDEMAQRIGGKGLRYISGFAGVASVVDVGCTVCGYVWATRATNVLYNKGCPKCAGKRHTEDTYRQELKRRDIEYVRGYSKAHEVCTHRCLRDGFEWEATPANIRRGTGCPKCAPYGFQLAGPANLYFLLSQDGYLKIGITGANVKRRMQNIKYKTPFDFILYASVAMEGRQARSVEKSMHAALAAYSAGFTGFDGCSEWFRATDIVMSAVKEVVSNNLNRS